MKRYIRTKNISKDRALNLIDLPGTVFTFEISNGIMICGYITNRSGTTLSMNSDTADFIYSRIVDDDRFEFSCDATTYTFVRK